MKFNPHPFSLSDIFLVGGAVRDDLMGQKISDKDYVVVNHTPEQMEQLGFFQVGKDFPVFLNPQTNEEYALARKEKKVSKGYTGFSTITQGISLADDLLRRDLTINAIAMDANGNILDPFNGKKDIENKVLRHVSDSFKEDPLRVLRIARFASRYHHLGFSIAPSTMKLMKQMVDDGELSYLTPERVWLEIKKLSHTPRPSVFFNVLKQCGALKVLMPEVDALYGVPQVAQYHPEIDTGIHTEMVCDMATSLSIGDVDVLFSSLVHDLGKALTPKNEWPSHHGHEEGGVIPTKNLCKRLKVPSFTKKLAILTCKYHLHAHRALEARTGTILNLFERLDAFRNPKIFEKFLIVCEADKRGRKGFTNHSYPQKILLEKCFNAAKSVSGKKYVEQGMEGVDIANAIRNERLIEIKKAQVEFKSNQDKVIQSIPLKTLKI